MNRILSLLLCAQLVSCTMLSNKNHYGVLSTNEVRPGDTLKMTNEKIEDSNCLYIILGLIPIGNYSLNNISGHVDEIVKERKVHSLGNVEIEQKLKMFFPFYYSLCNTISAQGLQL